MIFGILSYCAPLLLASCGALASEYAGRMALFMDGIINLAAFLCFAFTITTHSAVVACLLSAACCVIFIGLAEQLIEKTGADPFLSALALNLFCSGLVTVLSALIFGTRGVLTSAVFAFNTSSARIYTTVASFVLAAAAYALLRFTRTGLYIRITGSDADVLASRGIQVSWCRTIAWSFAAGYGALAGCFLCIRLSSFVPNISSGRGWIALAAVFLGKKKPLLTATAVIVFSAAGYASSYLQNILPSIPQSLLISLPYLTALCLCFIFPRR